jgi:excisionase family DNA binding protein
MPTKQEHDWLQRKDACSQNMTSQSEGASSALTVKETAEALSIHPRTVWEEVRAGRLAAIKIGPKAGAVRITRAEIARYLSDAKAWEPSA